MKDLITEARELCADAQLEAALLELKTMSGWLNKVVYHKPGIRWSFDNNNLIHWIVVFMRLLPELCDALEKAEAEIKRLREKQNQGKMLNPAGEYAVRFAENHGMSVAEAMEQPMVKARFKFFNDAGI